VLLHSGTEFTSSFTHIHFVAVTRNGIDTVIGFAFFRAGFDFGKKLAAQTSAGFRHKLDVEMFFGKVLDFVKERTTKFNANALEGRGRFWAKFWKQNRTDDPLNVPPAVAVGSELFSDKLKLLAKCERSVTVKFSPMHSRADSRQFVFVLTEGGEGHSSAGKTRFARNRNCKKRIFLLPGD
jgi:hypothetical protein